MLRVLSLAHVLLSGLKATCARFCTSDVDEIVRKAHVFLEWLRRNLYILRAENPIWGRICQDNVKLV